MGVVLDSCCVRRIRGIYVYERGRHATLLVVIQDHHGDEDCDGDGDSDNNAIAAAAAAAIGKLVFRG